MRRILAYLLILIAVSFAVSYTVMNFKEKRLQEYSGMAASLNEDDFRATTNMYRKIFTSVYMNKIDVPEVKHLLEDAYKNKTNTDADRRRLYENMLPVYLSLKNVHLDNIIFYFPDSKGFLRINKDNVFSGVVGPGRTTVLTANEKDQFAEGFEEGQSSIGYRFVFPLDSEDSHLGTVEFVVGLDGLINTMNELYGNAFKYLILKKDVKFDHSSTLHELTDGIYVDECNACSSMLNTDYSFMVNSILAADLPQKLNKQFYKFEKFSYVAGYKHTFFVITLNPIKLTDGRGIGYILSYNNDITIDKINRYYMMFAWMLISVFILVLMGIAVLDHLRREASTRSIKLANIVDEKIREIRNRDAFFAQQGKMVTVGEMLSSILHQWKQPVSSISMMADMVEFECNKVSCTNDDALKLIGEIKNQTKFMNQTVNDFMSFFKPSDKPTVFNVCESIDELIKLFEFSFARHNTSFVKEWCEGCCSRAYIFGFPNEFKHVLLNLFNNSRDAIAEKRERMIADNLDVSKYKGEIRISLSIENGRIRVIVADTGGGIPQAVIDKIFDQHFSTKNEKGTGIGLYMAKSLVENNMNGTISVRNNEKGAEFILEFAAVNKDV